MADNHYKPDNNENDNEYDDLSSLPDLGKPGFDNNLDDLDTGEIEIESGRSKLASAPAKNILLLVGLIVGSAYLLYTFVFKEDKATQEKKEIAKVIESQPVEEAIKPEKTEEELPVDVSIAETPELPKVEGLQPPPPPTALEEPTVELPTESFGGFEPATPPVLEPEPVKPVEQAAPAPAAPVITTQPAAAPLVTPLPTPAAPSIPPTVTITGPSPEEIAARQATRRKSGMMVLNGNVAASSPEAVSAGSPLKLAKTATAQVTATTIGSTDRMIAQGKLIDAVLETAINTDLPGLLRAVVSRDIYAESGKNILIPKGSRLVGDYSNTIAKGQQRVVVNWNRVIRPDGVDIAIASPGTDQLGRTGVTGIVDNKYMEILGRSLLLSIMSVGGAMAADAINPSSGATSSTSRSASGDTTTSTTATPTDYAIIDSVKNLGNVTSRMIEGTFNDKPTILVQQGSLIKVFVNKDLIFPESVAGKTNIIN